MKGITDDMLIDFWMNTVEIEFETWLPILKVIFLSSNNILPKQYEIIYSICARFNKKRYWSKDMDTFIHCIEFNEMNYFKFPLPIFKSIPLKLVNLFGFDKAVQKINEALETRYTTNIIQQEQNFRDLRKDLKQYLLRDLSSMIVCFLR